MRVERGQNFQPQWAACNIIEEPLDDARSPGYTRGMQKRSVSQTSGDAGSSAQASLGAQELEVLRYVSDHSPVTVREVADTFGATHGLARTTILTVMERLRVKGFLERRKEHGLFLYAPAVAKKKVLQSIVETFVEKTLGGSLTPFVSYLAESRGLSDGELKKLKKLLEDR